MGCTVRYNIYLGCDLFVPFHTDGILMIPEILFMIWPQVIFQGNVNRSENLRRSQRLDLLYMDSTVKCCLVNLIILSHWITKIARMPTFWWLRATCELLNELCKVCGTNVGACKACGGWAMTRADEPHDHQHKYGSGVKNGTATRQTFQLTCYNCYTIRNCCVVSWLCILVLTRLRNQI